MTTVQTVDVGNSSVGVATWSGEDASLERESDPRKAAGLITGPARVLSVNAARLEALLSELSVDLRDQLQILQGVPLPVASSSLARSAGHDRLAAARALLPGPAVVVDAGTAVTVDLVDASGTYIGGFIAPGPAAASAGLSLAAPALPKVLGRALSLVPGQETLSALEAGAWGLAVGGVDRLVSEARRALGVSAPVVATGG